MDEDKSESKKIDGWRILGSKEGDDEGRQVDGGFSTGRVTKSLEPGSEPDIGGIDSSIDEGREIQTSTESKRESSCLEASSKNEQAL